MRGADKSSAHSTMRRLRTNGEAFAIALLIFGVALMTACSGTQTPEPAIHLTPTPTIEPTMRLTATHTPLPTPTATPVPTQTELPTLTPEPTHTPEAIAVATDTPQPEPTRTPRPTHTPPPTFTPEPTYTPILQSNPTPEPFITIEPNRIPAITIGDVVFDLEIAYTPETRTQGLSDRNSLPQMTGMLFVFEDARTPTFWMYHMRFNLDFVWIGEDCTVADIHRNVPRQADGQQSSDLPRYSPEVPVLYNLEINSGLADSLGIEIGDKVTFSGFSGSGAVCR